MEETINDTAEQVDQQQPPKLSVKEFAAKIKAKYPDYANVNDDELVQKIITKYPDYKEQVDFSEKKNLGGNVLPNGVQGNGTSYSKNTNGIDVKKAAQEFEAQRAAPLAANEIRVPHDGQGSTEEIDPKNIKPLSIEEAHNADKNILGNIWNHFTSGVGKLAAAGLDLGGQLMVKLTPNQKGETDESRLKFIRENVVAPSRTATTELVGAKVTPEQKRAFDKGFITRGVGGLAEMLPALGGKGAGLILQGYDSGLESINSTPAGKALPENTKTIFGATVGTTVGLMNMLALDKIFGKQTNKIASDIAVSTLSNLIKKEGEAVTAQIAEKAILLQLKSLKSQVLSGAVKVGRGAVIGGTVGGVQEGANILAEKILNKSQDEQVFDEGSWKDNLSRIGEGMASGGVGGAILGATSVPFSKAKNFISEKVAEAKSPEDIVALKEELRNSHEGGKMSVEEIGHLNSIVDDYVRVNSKVPDTVPNRKEAVEKIMEREDVQKEISKKQDELQNVDEAFQSEMQQEIEVLHNRADEINHEILNPPPNEQATETQTQKEASSTQPESTENKTNEISTEEKVTEPAVSVENKATELWDKRVAEGGLGVFSKMPKDDGIKMVAEQAQNVSKGKVADNKSGDAYEATVNQFGKPLVDAAIEKHPLESLINTNEKEAAKVSDTETQTSTPNESVDKIEQSAEAETGNTSEVGVSHKSLTGLAKKLGLKEPERGQRLTPEQYADRGRQLLNAGADVVELEQKFKDGKQPTANDISVARAHLEDLTKIADAMKDKWGKESKQFEDANKEVDRWVNEVVKPMGTAASEPFTALQGDRDLDTDSFVTVKRTLEDNTGKPVSKEQEKKIDELTTQNNVLKKQAEDLEAKVIRLTDENVGKDKANKKFAEKAKNVADKFRKLKSKPLTFKDKDGNDIPVQIQGISWNDLVELGAKAIEKTGEIADGIAAIVDKVKDTNWYKNLSDDDKTSFAQKLDNHYTDAIKESPEAKRIKSLEKQRDDLLEGKSNQKSDKPEYKFTDEEKQKVKDLEDEIYELKKGLGLVKGKAEKPLTDKEQIEADNKEVEDLQKKFVDKKDNKFTPEEAKSIWDYAKKNYLEKGVPYKDMIAQVKNDLGLSWMQVSNAITSPKTEAITLAMWKKQGEYRRNQLATKNWIETQDENPTLKVIKKVSGAFRGVAVFGHGGIFMGTHAGMTLFQPTTWNKTIPAFFRGWKYAYGDVGAYEKEMQAFQYRPTFDLAQRAGLKNNPERLSGEEYQKSQKYLGKLGMAGERGFNAVKVLRQDLFDFHYDKLSVAEKADPQAVESVAKLANLATGATNLKIPEAVNEITFAGGMEAARWGKLTRSPIKASTTALKALFVPDKVSVEDKVFAKVWARRVGEQLATFTGLLLANAAIQNTLHPKNPTNLYDPNKPDFLKFKFGDKTIDPTSGMLGVSKFIYGIGKIPFETKKERHGDNVIQSAGKQTFGYGRGKLAPLYSTVVDFYTKTDFGGNPLPYNDEKPSAYKHKLTWGEYAWEKAPLPVAEAAKVTYESAVEHGANKVTLNHVLNGIVSGAISGSSGFRVGEFDAEAEDKKHKPFSDEELKDPVFKTYRDAKLEMPNTLLTSEEVTDEEAGTKKKVSDYPKDIQEKYVAKHKELFKEELSDINENKTVFVKHYKDADGKPIIDVSTNEPDEGNYKEVEIEKLSKEEKEQVLKIAQSQATKKTKEEIFYNK